MRAVHVLNNDRFGKSGFRLGVSRWAGAVSICLVVMAFSRAIASSEPTAEDILKASQKAYDALTSYSDESTAEVDMKGEHHEIPYTTRLLRPNFYKIEWTGTSASGPVKGVCRSDGTASITTLTFANSPNNMLPLKGPDMQTSIDSLVFATGGVPLAIDVPGILFPSGKSTLTYVLNPKPGNKMTVGRQADEKIGQTDCFVVTVTVVMNVKGASGKTWDMTSTTELSIGEEDYLIRRLRSTSPGIGGKMTMAVTHGDISANPHLSAEDFGN